MNGQRYGNSDVSPMKHLIVYKKARAIAVKHKRYLKERRGIQRNLLVQDYQLHQILAIIGTILLAVLISLDYQQCDTNEHQCMIALVFIQGLFAKCT